MAKKLPVMFAIILLLALACGTAAASDGKCGENVSWELDSSGTLTISGSGAMYDYETYGETPSPFYNDETIQQVIVEEGVTHVGKSAFEDCDGITSVTLAPSVSSIGEWAFYYCSSLKSFTILGTYVSVGEGAVQACNPELILYGFTASTIRDYAAENDIEFSNPKCGADTTYDITGAGKKAIISGSGATWDYGITNNPSPIGKYFPGIDRAEIGEGVTEIGNRLFGGCEALYDVHLPLSLKTIGTGAFIGCLISRIDIPESVISISANAFAYCSRLNSATILNPSVSIASSAFHDCSDYLVISGWSGSTAQTYAGEQGIYFSVMKKTGKCGDNLTWKLDTATGTVTISGTGAMTDYDIGTLDSRLALNPAIRKAVIGSGVTSVGSYAFYECTYLTEITLPDTLKHIGGNAFCGSALTKVSIPEGTASVGESAFRNCWQLSYVTIPSGVTSLGDYVFHNCPKLKSISIPGSVKAVPDDAFGFCTQLAKVTIREGTKSVGDSAFTSCGNLKIAELPSTMESIGNSAFYYCSSLSEMILPAKTVSVGSGAFQYCRKLTRFYAYNSGLSFGSDVFYYHGTGLVLHAAEGSTTEALANANGIPFVPLMMTPAFSLPAKTGEIGDEAFSGISAKAVYIPNGAKRIGTKAFANCTALQQIRIPRSVDTIAADAFSGCPVSLIIYGEAGSTAEEFADSKGYTFRAE